MMSTRVFTNALFILMVIAGLSLAAPPGMSQANVTGQWQTLPYTMPINPIHVVLLNTGNVLAVAGTGNDPLNPAMQAALWNRQAGTITVQNVSFDMFCN